MDKAQQDILDALYEITRQRLEAATIIQRERGAPDHLYDYFSGVRTAYLNTLTDVENAGGMDRAKRKALQYNSDIAMQENYRRFYNKENAN